MKSFIKLDLPPNQHKSASLDKGIDVFDPQYMACSERYQRQGLERWLKEHPDAESENDFEPQDYGLEFVETF